MSESLHIDKDDLPIIVTQLIWVAVDPVKEYGDHHRLEYIAIIEPETGEILGHIHFDSPKHMREFGTDIRDEAEKRICDDAGLGVLIDEVEVPDMEDEPDA